MKTLLYVKANPKTVEFSKTFQISERFIEAYKELNPKDEIITLDLYNADIEFLSHDDVMAHSEKSMDYCNITARTYAQQFALADKYVIAAPLWNLGIPSILKAYFDYVSVSGISFKYTENGPVGMLTGKKALFVAARGGFYDKPPASEIEMGERYVRTIMGFFGISDFTAVAANGLDVQGQNVKAIMQAAVAKAEIFAKTF